MNIDKLPKAIKILMWPFMLIGMNLYVWSKLPLALLPHQKIKKGDKFEVLEDIKGNGLIHYRAPFTDGFECIIPKGTILEAFSDSDRISLGFGCLPKNKEEFENLYVPENQRKSNTYDGYSLVFRYNQIGSKLKKL